jgi:hypothetical protein
METGKKASACYVERCSPSTTARATIAPPSEAPPMQPGTTLLGNDKKVAIATNKQVGFSYGHLNAYQLS